MSLQLIAKEMESKGRKGDSMLVHMTPGEVAGLQKLAESAGGSLTVNPDTGLVEANFLKQMLPTLVGAGVGFFTANPMLGAAAGAAVGGYQAKRAGQDVGAGVVMGGLGGYGGASLGSSLQAAGAPAAAGSAGGGAASKTATNMATNAVMNQALSGGQQAAPAPFLTPAQQDAVAGSYGMDVAPRTTAGTGAGAPNVQVPMNASASGNAPAGAPTKFADMTYSQRMEQGLGGIKAFGTEEGRDKALKSMGGSEGVMRMLMMAGLPAMYGARTSVPHPYPLLSADVNKRGFAEGGEVGFFAGGGTGQNGAIAQAMANRPFIIDPATGNVIRNPNLPPPAATTFADMGTADGRSGEIGYTPNADFVTPEQQRAYYAENPTMANVTGIGQEIFGMTPLGIAQNAIAPEFVQAQRDMVSQAPAPVDDRSVQLGTTVGSGIGTPDIQGTALGDLAGSSTVSDGPSSTDGGYSESATSQQAGEHNAAGGAIYAQGGLMGLAKGGMRSGGFVVPADVVSMVGEGNTDAGYKRIKAMVPSATAIKGKDGGQSDTVKTNIEGKQRARVAHGEMYIPPEAVKRLGGAKKLYAMMDRVRQQATGSKKQIKPVSLKRAMA
jgi:hypothetical protein